MAELYGNDSNRESKKIRNQYKNKVQIYEGRMKTGKILMATGILCTVGILIIISFGNMDFNTVVLGIILFILCVAMIIGMILMDESEPKYKKSLASSQAYRIIYQSCSSPRFHFQVLLYSNLIVVF